MRHVGREERRLQISRAAPSERPRHAMLPDQLRDLIPTARRRPSLGPAYLAELQRHRRPVHQHAILAPARVQALDRAQVAGAAPLVQRLAQQPITDLHHLGRAPLRAGPRVLARDPHPNLRPAFALPPRTSLQHRVHSQERLQAAIIVEVNGAQPAGELPEPHSHVPVLEHDPVNIPLRTLHGLLGVLDHRNLGPRALRHQEQRRAQPALDLLRRHHTSSRLSNRNASSDINQPFGHSVR